QKLIDAGNFRAGGSCFFKAAELAKQHGKEEDMISAAKSAMGMFLKSSGEMKEIGFKAQAEADHTYAVSIAKLYRLEAPE
ncbi:MAG: hypothetical protein ABSA33_03565, partial [Candidatus Micrarchaeaceae archaeon]